VSGWALASAGLSPILLVAAWLVADEVQPGSYSPVRQTMSVLAGHAATDRWIMSGAMFLTGGCYLLTALGLSGLRTSARVVLAVAGLSGIGIAASPEPAHGSTPQHLALTAVFVALLGWVLVETHDGSALGLAERVTTTVQMSWPFVVALALRRSQRGRIDEPARAD